MIYLELEGRIGNQLFMYAAARTLQLRSNEPTEIVIDDRLVKRVNWENSLVHYELPEGVRFVSDNKIIHQMDLLRARWDMFKYHHFVTRMHRDYRSRYNFEVAKRKEYQSHGLVRCENGYIPLPESVDRDIYMSGYFQSEKFFLDNREEIKKIYRIEDEVKKSGYPGLDKIQNRNSVCISIKVEHNVGNQMYDVCTREYWEKAIQYIIDNVENPLFFICSDNVPYVLEHFIDADKYDVVFQSRDYPVHISLAVMAQCKHFIIGNTSFGWWAQYLSDNEDKIVITPSRWYGIDVPCDLYMDNWTSIDV